MKTLVIVIAAVLSAVGNMQARIGDTVEQVGKLYGEPIEDEGTAKTYAYGGMVIGIVFDANEICQGVVYGRFNGEFSDKEVSQLDAENIPVNVKKGSWKEIPVPANPYVNVRVWYTLDANILKLSGYYTVSAAGIKMAARGYTTMEGAKLFGSLGGENTFRFPNKAQKY
jgi:hypothetical protein